MKALRALRLDHPDRLSSCLFPCLSSQIYVGQGNAVLVSLQVWRAQMHRVQLVSSFSSLPVFE